MGQENSRFLSPTGSPGTKEVSIFPAPTQWCVLGGGGGGGVPPSWEKLGGFSSPIPRGRHTFFFCPESEAILGGPGRPGLLCSQEQDTKGYHGWMRLADLQLQEVAICVVAWGG